MHTLQVTRQAVIPDKLRISRYKKNPELGPRILFFSGGSALNKFSQTLKCYSHNSVHLVTPFDSGGSSAELRKAFGMPAIGDVRSRLMSLADESVLGQPEVFSLFSYRLPSSQSNDELKVYLKGIIDGKSGLLNAIANPMRRIITNQLGYFYDEMPDDFDLRGASIGNLILTGGYLNNHKHLEPIVFLFSKLVNAQGIVRTVVNDNVHLAATLSDGQQIVGQHNLTGKQVAPITMPITELHLTDSDDPSKHVSVELQSKNKKLIQDADLICYPPGSYYTSLMANLLPSGVGHAIQNCGGPKVYVPNLGSDPEQIGMSLEQMIVKLIDQLKADFNGDVEIGDVLNFVLLDSTFGRYPGGVDKDKISELGVAVVDVPLIRNPDQNQYDDELLAAALLSLT